ncbi:sigma-54 dependent transcriptional regulator [Desulfobulbus sp.]|uniref:sigma-54-dependent transcriptional regulator n=1 Tax=Desulfobulbus sp. TaxID=895 RepID=UPI00286F699F|nr:sigma-54 dependent transcriptional regulator [Desulfobulbus sp.]
MHKRTILVVDDEPIARDNLAHIIVKDGHAVRVAANGQEALALLRKEEVDLVLTDLRMQGIDGMAVLEEAKRLWPAAEVVMITGHASVDTAVEAMRKGAYHYVAKPFKINELRVIVDKALEKGLLRREIQTLREQVDVGKGTGRIVGQSPKMQALRETINQVSQLDCNVLIQGETGTGKELVARTIHECSPRARKRFVAFNCGVFTEELIASELFGYERGAFTGAGKAKKGLLETAAGGTVFFDEVGELPLSMQVKLLRVLQERTLIRVGGTEEVAVDFRVLAATNKDLKREVEAGTFRSDLYYRLDVLTINVPSLAERKDDIPVLMRHFLAKHVRPGRTVPQLSSEAERRLMFYEYPGNIRELENIAQRMLIACDGEPIEARHIAAAFGDSDGVAVREQRQDWPTLEEHEKRYILEVLDEVEGNRSAAVKILGIDRVSLWRKIKRYGLEHPDS